MCVVRLLAEISTVGVGFCKTHTTVPQSIWHFRSKNGYAIFHCYEYYLDSLHSVSINCNKTSANCSDTSHTSVSRILHLELALTHLRLLVLHHFLCYLVCICGWSWFALTSADTLTRGGGRVDIPGLSMDGHSYSGIRRYSDGGGEGWTSLDYPWMVTVTLASVDTLTRGGGKGGHPWTIHGWSQLLWHPWIL